MQGDVALLGMLLDVGPAGGLRQVEDILHGVELDHVEVVLLALGHELGPAFFEFIGDELEEDQREDDVLVFRGLDGAAELVGGVPEGFFGFSFWPVAPIQTLSSLKPLLGIHSVILLQFIIQLRSFLCHLSWLFEEGFGCYGKELGGIGGTVRIHQGLLAFL